MDSDTPKTSFKSRGPQATVIIGLLVLVGAGAAGWYFFGRATPPPTTIAEPPPMVQPDAGVAEDATPVDHAQGDALLTSAAADLSKDPALAGWLSGPDLVRRVVAAVNAVAEGQSPRPMLAFLQPEGAFTVGEGTMLTMSNGSFARYDKATSVIASVDAEAVGRLYKQLHPFLQGAYREIAPPGARFDDALQKAIAQLDAVPLTDTPKELKVGEKGFGYVFADPQLEALSPAQKHLLRMGPKNGAVVMQKLKAFEKAAGLSSP